MNGQTCGATSARDCPADRRTTLHSTQSMLLHADPSLAEVPGFTREQFEALAHSVEQRRQQLEHDIQRYIAARQHELRAFEQEQLAHHRSMECVASTEAASVNAAIDHGDDALPAATDAKSSPSPSSRPHDPEEKAKRTKHTRVQKREKELYGLVTPVFLPLLDARDTSPRQEKTLPEAHVTPGGGDAESQKVAHQERSDNQDMDTTAQAEPVRETYHVEPPRKTKRTAIKKSSLRAHNTSRSRRKRVSLVIDGQTVLPADTVVEPALTSPSETSASNSTTSLDDMIDPRLTRHDPPSHAHIEHHEAVHHSLPLPMSSIHSPTKPLIETPTELATSPASLRSSSTPSDPYTHQNPPSTALHTFLNNPSSIPTTAGPEPIYANDLEVAEEDEDQFHTYVGGLHGSGADDVDQAGSYGYPSSLGASYLESYMQSRPLKVRMDAVERAGLEGREKTDMMSGGVNGNGSGKEKGSRRNDEDEEEFGMDMQFGNGRDGERYHEHRHEDDEMDIVGSMEGF